MLRLSGKLLKRFSRAFTPSRRGNATGGLLLLLLTLTLHVGCGDKVEFIRQGATEYFTQGFNPPRLNIIWMIDDRSPMYQARFHINAQATEFFRRLELSTTTYRMALVSADMEIHPGLKPLNNPVILTQSSGGTPEQRAANFSSLIANIINLRTGAINQGFESVLAALSGPFRPEANVPLVIIFLSDGDDSKDSTGSIAVKPISYYTSAYQSFVGNNPDLLRVYSINYFPAPAARCTLGGYYTGDIDLPGFQDRYFSLAGSLGGEIADLCAPFASNIDLTGLRLIELPRRFRLEGKPDPSTLKVYLTRDGQVLSDIPFVFNTTTNEIVFDVAPPEGCRIEIAYSPTA